MTITLEMKIKSTMMFTYSPVFRLTTWTQLDSAWNQATVSNHLMINIKNTLKPFLFVTMTQLSNFDETRQMTSGALMIVDDQPFEMIAI